MGLSWQPRHIREAARYFLKNSWLFLKKTSPANGRCWRWPLGYLWFRLIDNLRLEGSSNPQDSYGLVVPILVAGLLLRRGHHAKQIPRDDSTAGNFLLLFLLCGALAFFYLPTRLVEKPRRNGGQSNGCSAWKPSACDTFRHPAWRRKILAATTGFPHRVFLGLDSAATLVEAPIIQGSSRMNAGMVVNVLSLLSMCRPSSTATPSRSAPASSALVTLAAASARSSPANDFAFPRRILSDSAGSAVCCSCLSALRWQCCSTFAAHRCSPWIAAKKGIGAIAEYHDEAGLTILLVCTGLLWSAAWLLNLRRKSAVENSVSEKKSAPPAGENIFRRVNRFGLALVIWIIAAGRRRRGTLVSRPRSAFAAWPKLDGEFSTRKSKLSGMPHHDRRSHAAAI